DAGPPGCDHDLYVRVGELSFNRAAHEIGVVGDDRSTHDGVSSGRDQFGDGAATRVGSIGSRVADGDDVAADRAWSLSLVFGESHRRSRHCSPGPNAPNACDIFEVSSNLNAGPLAQLDRASGYEPGGR